MVTIPNYCYIYHIVLQGREHERNGERERERRGRVQRHGARGRGGGPAKRSHLTQGLHFAALKGEFIDFTLSHIFLSPANKYRLF